ncbi:acetyltransferase [Halocella sp. SP3-1]|nr:acetyltransferase [Halocella sp. SP3-1]AZO96322.1 acetyltransferase [Halocella sp. SP3-1]
MEDILLIGGGGHCKSVIDAITQGNLFNIVGVLDIREKVGRYVNNIRIVGIDDDLSSYYTEGIRNAFITLGSIGDPELRIKKYIYAKKIELKFPVIIDKSAIISSNIIIREGTFIGKGAIINTAAQIGKNCIINTGAVIEHDCIIDDFVHIAPGTVLSGGVHIGENSHIGTNSTVIQNIIIGSNTVIGAGSVVVKDINKNSKAYGNPCREVD